MLDFLGGRKLILFPGVKLRMAAGFLVPFTLKNHFVHQEMYMIRKMNWI